MRLFIASLATVLLATGLRAQDPKPAQFETAHFSIWSSAGAVPADDFDARVEALYVAWKDKLGQAVDPRSKIKLALYFDRQEFARQSAVRDAFYVLKGDTVHVLCDPRYFQGIAAGGTSLYLAAAYPKLANRKEVFPPLAAGLADYFLACQWKGGKVEVDSIKTPENAAGVASFQGFAKSPDWWAFDKGFRAEGRDFETRRRMITTQAWALFYFLFNAPGDEGGQGKAAGAAKEYLGALNDGRGVFEALGALAKKADAGSVAGLEKAVKDYFLKMKSVARDRDEGDWISAETAHYVIKVEKGAVNVKTRAADRQILVDLKGKMELLFEKYSAAFRLKTPLPQKATVKLYKNRAAYLSGKGPEGSAAYYDPNTQELVGYEDSQENGVIFQTLAHEGCHQFFDLAFPGFYASQTVPDWFSEGLAECFAASEVRGRDFYVFTLSGAGAYQLEWIKDAISKGQYTPIRTLVQLPTKDFLANATLHYAESWSFVHFLWNAPTPDQGKGKYHEVVVRLIEGFKTGKPRDDVYKDALQVQGKRLNFDDLEREWVAYIKALKPRK